MGKGERGKEKGASGKVCGQASAFADALGVWKR